MAPFTFVDLEQGTAAWKAWRRQGIGASDAPAIMGESPWKNRAQLAKEKRAPAIFALENAAMTRGNRLEPYARGHFIALSGIPVAPACLQSNAHPWLRASVDGICARTQRVIEIKCGTKVYDVTAKYSKPPRYYVAQLQHILAVTGYAMIDFCCFLPGQQFLRLEIARDEDYIRRMLAAEQKFWDDLQAA